MAAVRFQTGIFLVSLMAVISFEWVVSKLTQGSLIYRPSGYGY